VWVVLKSPLGEVVAAWIQLIVDVVLRFECAWDIHVVEEVGNIYVSCLVLPAFAHVVAKQVVSYLAVVQRVQHLESDTVAAKPVETCWV